MDGTITRVEFLSGGARLGESTDVLSLTWTQRSGGKITTLAQKRRDDRGATVTSAPVEIFVNGNGRSLQRRHRASRRQRRRKLKRNHLTHSEKGHRTFKWMWFSLFELLNL